MIRKKSLTLLVVLTLLLAVGTWVSFSANSTFVQTDWAGGISVSNATQTGWTKFASKDAGVDTSQPGKVTLTTTTFSIADNTDADFSKGILNKTVVSGTGAAATVDLVAAASDPFVSSLRKFPDLKRPVRVPSVGAGYVLVPGPPVRIYATMGGYSTTFAAYDPSTGKWVSQADLLEPVGYGGALAYPSSGGDFIYCIPGGSTRIFLRYQISADAWTQLSSTPLPFAAQDGTSMAAPGDGYLYVVFGNSASFQRFNIGAGSWGPLGNAPVNAGYGSELIKGDGTRLYYLPGGNYANFYRFDTSTLAWSAALAGIPSGAGKLGGHSAFYRLMNNSVYVARGNAYRNFWRYDVTGNAWDISMDLTPFKPDIGSGFVYAPSTDMLYAFPGNGNRDPVNYDFIGSKWAQPAALPWNGYYVGSHLGAWTMGKFYVLQGYPSQGFYSYDPAANHWTPLAAPPLAGHWGTCITANPNTGELYAIPRGDATGAGSSMYVYNADTVAHNGVAPGAWSAAAALPASAAPPGGFYYGASIAYAKSGTDEFIYAFRGWASNGFYRYVIAGTGAGTWQDLTATSPLPAPAAVSFGGNLLWPGSGDYLYAIPGIGTSGAGYYQGLNVLWRYSISTGIWSSSPGAMASVPLNYGEGAQMAADGAGTNLYLALGNFSTLFYRYTAATNQWTRLADVPLCVGGGSGMAYNPAANKIDLVVGYNRNNLFEYDVVGDTWSKSTSNARDDYNYPADRMRVLSNGNFIYPGAGDALYFLQQGGTKYFWRYSVANDRWEILADAPICGYGDAALCDGGADTLYLLEGAHTPNFYKYTISTNTWTTLANISNGAALDQPYYPSLSFDLAGGAVYAVVGNYTTNFRKYTVSTNSWSASNVLPANATSNYQNRLSNIAVSSGTRYLYLNAFSSSTTRYRFNLSSLGWETVTDSAAVSAAPYSLLSGNHQYYPGTGNFLYVLRGGSYAVFWKCDLGTGAWTRLKDVPIPVEVGSALAGSSDPNILYGLIYASWSGTSRPILMKYNISLNLWSMPSSNVDDPNFPTYAGGIPTSYSGQMTYAAKTNSIYLAYGNDSPSFYRYDLANDKWYWSTSLPWPSGYAGYNSSIVYDGSSYLYMPRGRGNTDFARYNIGTDTWEIRRALPAGFHLGGLSYPLGGDSLYALRGNNGIDLYRYSISQDQWTGLSSTPNLLTVIGGALGYPGSGNYLYALRGSNSTDFWRFNTSTNLWDPTPLAAPPVPINMRDNGFVYPGFGNYFFLVQDMASYLWRYNFVNNAWDSVGIPTNGWVPRSGSVMAYDENGFLYINQSQDELGNGLGLTRRIQIASVGTYTSEIKTVGKNSGFGAMTWADNGTQSIRVKVRTSNDSAMAGAPDWAVCPFAAKGANVSALSSVKNGDKFIQYRIVFSTDDLTQVPKVDSVTINYTKYPENAALTSSWFNTTALRNRFFKLLWTENKPAGSDVRFQLRTAPDSSGSPGIPTSWLGPGSTYAVNYDFSNAGDYAKSDQVKLSGGAATVSRDLENYLYQQSVQVDNTGGTAKTNEVVTLTLPSTDNAFWSKVKSDGSDLRFFNGSQKLSYNLVLFDYPNRTAKVSVKIPSIAAGAVSTISLIYGSAAAASESDSAVAPPLPAPPVSGLVGWWKFNEGGGTTALDSSGSFNTGSFSSAITYVPGIDGSALSFPGTVSVAVPTTASLQSNTMTVAAWVKRLGAGGILGRFNGVSSSSENGLYPTGSSLTAHFYQNATNNTLTGGSLPANEWHHVAFVLGNSSQNLYIDGQLVASGAVPGTNSPSNAALNIGWSWLGGYFNGLIDNVTIHNRALSASEISSMIPSTNVKMYLPVTEQAATSASLPGWLYKTALTIDNSANASALTNFQVKVTLDGWAPFWSHVKADGGDIRLVDSDDVTVLNHFIQSFDSTNKTGTVWVKAPSIPAASTKTIYLYCGNSAAASTSNAASTLIAFDDFNDGVLSGWTSGLNANWTESSGMLTHSGSAAETLYRDLPGTPSDYIVEMILGTGFRQGPGILFRSSSDTLRSYNFQIANFDSNQFYRRLYQRDSTAYVTSGWDTIYNKWLPVGDSGGKKVQVRVSGSNFKITVDGVLEADVTDPRLATGGVGVYAYNNGYSAPSVTFDDLLVRAYAPADPIVAAPMTESANSSAGSNYYATRPVIQPIFGAFYNNDLAQFSEISTTPSGTGIKYQISPNGYDWYWYSGASWGKVTGGFSQANTAVEVNANLASFQSSVAASGEFLFRAYLDSSGSASPTLDNLAIRTMVGVTYFTDPAGGEKVDASQSDAVNDQWVQYRMILDSNGEVIPELLDLALEYDTASITLTSPVGGETWIIGSAQTTTWTSNGLDSGDTVKIEYSTDNGSTWNLIASNAPNTGSYIWTVADAPSTQARVKVSSVNLPVITSTSPSAFIIAGSITVAAPNGGEVWPAGSTKNVTWTHHGIPGTTVKIEFSSNGGSTYPTLVATGVAKGAGGNGNYSWTLPTNVLSTTCRIQITDESNALVKDASDSNFEIGGSVINVTQPAAGDVVGILTTSKIKWTVAGPIPTGGTVRMEYSTDGKANGDPMKAWNLIDVNISPAAGAAGYDWAVPSAAASSTVVVRVSDSPGWDTLGGQNAVDGISGVFRVTGTVTVISPNGGEKWASGFAHTIKYQTQGSIGNVKISYSTDNFVTSVVIVSSTSNTGSYSWTPARTNAAPAMKIRVEDVGDAAVKDESDANLSVTGVTVTGPDAASRLKAGNPYTITWNQTAISNVKIEYAEDGLNYSTIVASTPVGTNSYGWTLPSKTMTGFRVRVSDADSVPPANGADAALAVDNSDASSVLYGTITVVIPNGGEDWSSSNPHDITWTVSPAGANVAPNVKIFYTTASFATETIEIDPAVGKPSNNNPGAGTGKYSWTPTFTAPNVKVRVADAGDPAVNAGQAAPATGQDQDDSNAYFTISGVSITSPKSGDSWLVGSQQLVSFGFTGTLTNVKLEYSPDGGTTFKTISANLSVATNPYTYTWTVPDDISKNVQVRATELNPDGSVKPGGKQAVSPNFTITGALVIATPPTLFVGDAAAIGWAKTGTIDSQTLEFSPSGTFSGDVQTLGTGLTGASFNWIVPDNIGALGKLRVTDTVSGHPATSSTTSAFAIQGKLTLTSPIAGNIWAALSPQTINWTTIGSIGKVGLDYSTNGGSTFTAVSGGTNITNGGSLSWIVPDVLTNPQTTPTQTVRLRITDKDHTGAAQASTFVDFTVNWFKITWEVKDLDNKSLLTSLSVNDSSVAPPWVNTTGALNAPAVRYYPYGTFTTTWSKAGYTDATLAAWVANSDLTNTLYMESSTTALITFKVYVGGGYEAGADTLKIKAWLERRGVLVADTVLMTNCKVEVYDDGTLLNTFTSTTPDVTGAYSFVWNNTLLAGGKVYFLKGAITYNGTVYTSGGLLNISIEKQLTKDLPQKADLDAAKTEILGKVAQTQQEVTSAKNEIVNTITTNVVGIKESVAQVQKTLGSTADVAGTNTVIGKLEDVKKVLGTTTDTGAAAAGVAAAGTADTVMGRLAKTQTQAENAAQTGLLNRETTIEAGKSLVVRYRAPTGLQPKIDLLNPGNSKVVSSQLMTEIANTGIYEYTVAFGESLGTGDFTVAVNEPTKGSMDAMVVTVSAKGPEDTAKSGGAGGGGGAVDLKPILDEVRKLVSGNANPAVLTDIQQQLLDLRGQLGLVGPQQKQTVRDQLAEIASVLQQMAGSDEGLNALFDMSKVTAANIKDLQNKAVQMSKGIEFLVESEKNKAVHTLTWYELGSIILKILVVNPTDQPQSVPVKAYLPKEVREEHIMSTEGDLELQYDSVRGGYFVTATASLKPNESVLYSVECEDIWMIPQEKLNQLSAEAQATAAGLKGSEHEQQATALAGQIGLKVKEIWTRQSDPTLTPERHIQVYRENLELFSQLENELILLRRMGASLLRPMQGEGVGALFFGKGAAYSLSTAATWRLIFGLLIFVGLMSLVAFLLWQRQAHLAMKAEIIALEHGKNLGQEDEGKHGSGTDDKPLGSAA